MPKITRPLITLISIITVVTAAAFIYDAYRKGVMNRLYVEAVGYPQFFRSTAQSTEAVRKLATYHGSRATQMLLDIALAHGPLVWSDAQAEAIKALGNRNDAKVGVAVAKLLQLHEALETRKAAAEALQYLPCNETCAYFVLHYLEEVWRGDPNYEDRTVRPSGFQDVAISLKRDQEAVYTSLYSVLQREKLQTLKCLVEVYGLGSDAPSPFGIYLVSQLSLSEACALLQQSNQAIQKRTPESYAAPRQELQAAIASLQCK